MKTLNMPELIALNAVDTFKILQVSGNAGMKMPLHHVTKETVVMVQKGSALLTMDEEQHMLMEGSTFVIPARQNYSFSLKTGFKALMITSQDTKIKFAD
jgi:quercetin dioxygenase-like cupin family protein